MFAYQTIFDDKICLFVCFFFLPDMINMFKLGYVPQCCSWVFSAGDAVQAVAV